MIPRAQLLKIARRARRTCEIYVENEDIYEADQIDTSCEKELDCFCAISSAFLQRMLTLQNIPAKIATGQYRQDGHAWVETTTHIIDLTLTQFNPKAKVVTILPKNHRDFKKEEEGTNLTRLFDEWPETQKPTRKRLGRLKKIYTYGHSR